MDLRGFPQITVNNNLMMASNNMLTSEMQSRNYTIKRKTPKLYSMNPILDKFIENIKNNNNAGLEQLLNEYGNICDEEGLDPIKIAILCQNIDSLRLILEE